MPNAPKAYIYFVDVDKEINSRLAITFYLKCDINSFSNTTLIYQQIIAYINHMYLDLVFCFSIKLPL